MTTLRDRYAEALLRRLETHEGPVADAERYMERLDVLAGVDLEQKRLSAGVHPESQGVHPEIEPDDSPVAVSSSEGDVAAPEGSEGSSAAGPPVPVHEATQQAPVSASAGLQVNDRAPADSTPAAPSSEPIPTEPYDLPSTVRIRKPRDKTTVDRPCDCGCGFPLHIPRWEINRDPEKKFFLNRDHYHDYQRSPKGTGRASAVGGVRYVEENEPEVEEPPARGLAAVTANPPVEAPPSKFVCTCPDRWREKTQGWREDVPNEGHHEDCALYRKGGHRWPMPPQGSERNEPFTIMCGWCTEQREVDRFGVEWSKSEENPAVTITSPYSKNAKAPA